MALRIKKLVPPYKPRDMRGDLIGITLRYNIEYRKGYKGERWQIITRCQTKADANRLFKDKNQLLSWKAMSDRICGVVNRTIESIT